MPEIRRAAEAMAVAGITFLAAQGALAEGRDSNQIQECIGEAQNLTHETVTAAILQDNGDGTNRDKKSQNKEGQSEEPKVAILAAGIGFRNGSNRRKLGKDYDPDPNLWVKDRLHVPAMRRVTPHRG